MALVSGRVFTLTCTLFNVQVNLQPRKLNMAIKSFLGKMVGRFVSEKFVNNCKRTIFMTTLYLKMKRVDDVKDSDLLEMNKELSLVNDPSALKFPAALGDSLWKGRDFEGVQREIASDNMSMVCRSVMSITPRWVCYGVDPRQMERDITSVAKSVRTMALA